MILKVKNLPVIRFQSLKPSFNLENARSKKIKSRYRILTYFDEEGKICDREGELDQQSIFEATFRKILVLLGCIRDFLKIRKSKI